RGHSHRCDWSRDLLQRRSYCPARHAPLAVLSMKMRINAMSRKNFLFVLTVIALLSSATWAQVPEKQKVVAGADRAFEKFTKAYVAPAPGCAAAVSLNGEVVFEKAFGLADLEHN